MQNKPWGNRCTLQAGQVPSSGLLGQVLSVSGSQSFISSWAAGRIISITWQTLSTRYSTQQTWVFLSQVIGLMGQTEIWVENKGISSWVLSSLNIEHTGFPSSVIHKVTTITLMNLGFAQSDCVISDLSIKISASDLR